MRRSSGPPVSLDWAAIARTLLAEAVRPTLLFDSRGVLHAVNALVEPLLGDPVGRTWAMLFERSLQGDAPTTILHGVLRGDERDWVVTSGAWSLRCRGLVVTGGSAVLVTVNDWWRGAHRETAYQISTARERFGQLLGARSAALVGRVCHEALWARSTPCNHCPVRDGERPRVEVWASDHALDIVASERVSEHVASVQVQRLDDEATQALLAARRARLAAKHGLSPREREVLDLLCLGRTTHEIATALAITLRTAKYHQSNVLTKLGLDSRLELLRLFA